jgi:hypothetical protein
MRTLPQNWLTEGLIDFEYKKYILLSYTQQVKGSFKERKLYPYLSDLVFHYQNLVSIREHKKLLYENFPQQISRADFEKLHLTYEKMVQDDDIMAQLEDILSYSIPRFKEMLNEGKDIYELVEEHLNITPVGLSSLYPNEGYLFVSQSQVRETQVYQYQITLFENAHEKFRGVHTYFLESVTRGVGVTYETLKVDLTRKYQKLANPATYLVQSNISCPLDETLLPIAKRMLVRYIGTST